MRPLHVGAGPASSDMVRLEATARTLSSRFARSRSFALAASICLSTALPTLPGPAGNVEFFYLLRRRSDRQEGAVQTKE